MKLTINLYGNSIVFAGIHHTLITIDYDGRFRLLEVVGGNGDKIRIHDVHGKTEADVLKRRMRKGDAANRWGDGTRVICDDIIINKVVKEYNDSWYKAFGWVPFNYPRNCRTFVNRVFEACGSERRTGKNIIFE